MVLLHAEPGGAAGAGPADFTTAVAGGDFNARLNGTFKYELANLAENLRSMVAQLKNRLGFSQGLLDGLTLSCLVADPDEKLVFLNQPVLDFLELPGKPADYLGRTVSEFFYNEQGRSTIIGKSMRERQPVRGVQFGDRPPPGNSRFTQVDAAPCTYLDGTLIAGSPSSPTDRTQAQQDTIAAQNEKIAKAAAAASPDRQPGGLGAEELSAQVEQSAAAPRPSARATPRRPPPWSR